MSPHESKLLPLESGGATEAAIEPSLGIVPVEDPVADLLKTHISDQVLQKLLNETPPFPPLRSGISSK